jgi:sigma54-dependent transcription regulator
LPMGFSDAWDFEAVYAALSHDFSARLPVRA